MSRWEYIKLNYERNGSHVGTYISVVSVFFGHFKEPFVFLEVIKIKVGSRNWVNTSI